MNTRNFIIVLLIVIIIISGIYFFYKLNSDTSIKKDEEVKSLVFQVSELYLLPEGETPIVATVSNPDVSFFKLSKKDDKVLMFPNNGKAVLYRPSINKIIDIVLIKSDNQNNDEDLSILEETF